MPNHFTDWTRDRVFEPAMQPTGMLAGVLGGIFGIDEGSGMALQHTLFSLLGSAIGLGGYFFPILRDVEKIVPDHEVSCSLITIQRQFLQIMDDC